MRGVVLWLPLAAAVVAAVVTLTPGPMPVHSFYDTAALVMPVLIVALVVERRALEVLRSNNAARVLMLTAMLAGESAALIGSSGVFRGHTGSMSFEQGTVATPAALNALLAVVMIGGFVCSFVMLAVLALTRVDDQRGEGDAARR
ncbi:MAG: hypothetical protein ACTHM1_00975 [Solirubrobacteraceae bacterium]